jgi:PEGA domain
VGVPVSAGRRRLRLDAPGHTTRELDVDVAGGGEQVIRDGLDVRRAPLTQRSDTDEASVRVDGREVARTPVEGPVMLPEGTFQLEVTRPGYVSVRREVTLGVAGSTRCASRPTGTFRTSTRCGPTATCASRARWCAVP